MPGSVSPNFLQKRLHIGAHNAIRGELRRHDIPVEEGSGEQIAEVVVRLFLGSYLLVDRMLWLQGFPDQARRIVEMAVENACAINAFTMCAELWGVPCFAVDWRSYRGGTLRQDSARLLDTLWLATLSGLGSLLSGTHPHQALWHHQHADFGEAVAGVDARYCVMFLGEMAHTLARAGRATEGLAAVEPAIDRASRFEEGWLLGGLLRVNGELSLLQAGQGAAPMAEDCFRHALDSARRQGALSWELRAAMSLARLRRDQNRRADALALLQPLYDRFTEGFDTADLREAKVLLDTLP
jgi:hypothetical protein